MSFLRGGMCMMKYHIFTISTNQAKKTTVAYVDTKEEAEELCSEHILYAYEKISVECGECLGKPKVCVNY